jgi:hypothetical protein
LEKPANSIGCWNKTISLIKYFSQKASFITGLFCVIFAFHSKNIANGTNIAYFILTKKIFETNDLVTF